ncbi:hypothetical protein Sta7437_1863 [Stanieria cyanosphaera PCC 7437]|uniref:Uncharacterized protein n=1 Tax=Stanieria cyanosphaera (strain ATCC 29371 / PCC 7437) TaxID=111780 RepID=K9XTM8_STAC7|nr:hypothetical protein [Stanieria cyanosphaera]AFZ35419.1 hypothetical protein Sta7437_1863 [Stanieria cyanosphaera PCC 7437]
MASKQEVKMYLAYWFQLGKKIILNKGIKQELLPQPVISGERYSQQFENVWHQITQEDGQNWYLEGTSQTIAELFSSTWEITDCARCGMPVAIVNLGLTSDSCPCKDLPSWPNSELPQPRSPVVNHQHLTKLQERLHTLKNKF